MKSLALLSLVFVLFLGIAVPVSAVADERAVPKEPVMITDAILTGVNTAIFTIQDADGVDYLVVVLRGKDARDIAAGTEGKTVFVYEELKLIILLDLSVEI